MTKTSSFCSIHQENTCKSCLHSNLIIFSDFHSFTMKKEKIQNWSIFKISANSELEIQVKIWKSLKLLNSVLLIKKTLVNQVYIRIWSFWLTFTVLQWMKKNSKTISIFKFTAKVWVSDQGQNLIMIKTSYFLYFHQENTCKSILHLNLIILTDFHRFSVNEDNLQNYSIWRFP